MFSKRHYVAIAEVLRANQPGKHYAARRTHHRWIVDQLANMFVQDNPRFDWQRFLNASLGH